MLPNLSIRLVSNREARDNLVSFHLLALYVVPFPGEFAGKHSYCSIKMAFIRHVGGYDDSVCCFLWKWIVSVAWFSSLASESRKQWLNILLTLRFLFEDILIANNQNVKDILSKMCQFRHLNATTLSFMLECLEV